MIVEFFDVVRRLNQHYEVKAKHSRFFFSYLQLNIHSFTTLPQAEALGLDFVIDGDEIFLKR